MSVYVVTGAAGFIASRVAERLLEDGHSVHGIDNLNDAYDRRLKEWRLNRLKQHAGFELQVLDVGERTALERYWATLPQVDAVINLAARAGVRQSVENPWVYMETNATGTLNLLELARRSGVPKFMLASTSSLYGQNNPMPYREDANTSRPLSPYAASKSAAESMCASYHHLYGTDVTICRYFTVYGPAGRPDMSVFRFIQWIAEGKPVTVYGDGQQSRDFTYVDDIARGTIAALKPVGFEVVNLGSDRPLILMDVLRLIERLLGREAKIDYRPAHRADVNATWANVDKARTLLGWQPEVGYEQGIENAVRWYCDNREWAKEIPTE